MAELTIDSHGCAMSAILYIPQGPGPHPTVALLHGFPGNERNLDLAQVLRRAGWNVMVFHYRGNWGSAGDYSFAHVLEDVEAALAFLRSGEARAAHRVDASRLVLVGHSLGGFAALMVAASDAGVAAMASISGVNFAVSARALVGLPRQEALLMFQEALSRLHGTTAETLLEEILQHGDDWDLARLAGVLAGRPVLLVAASRDEGLPPEAHHAPLVKALRDAGSRQLTEVVLDSDHGYNDRRIALARTLLAWLQGLPIAPGC